jgi:hypothetical protein
LIWYEILCARVCTLGCLTSLPQISFTFILPLFPKLLEFYRNAEAPADGTALSSKTLLSSVLGYLNDYKAAFARPIDSRYDIVLLGGALGSLFSCVPTPTPPYHARSFCTKSA